MTGRDHNPRDITPTAIRDRIIAEQAEQQEDQQ